MCLFVNTSRSFRRLYFSFLRSFDCLLKRAATDTVGEGWGLRPSEGSESAETRRTERSSLPLSHYPVTPLCFPWQGRSPHRSVLLCGLRNTPNTWRVTLVGGVMMEKVTRRGKHERKGGGGGGGGEGWSRCGCMWATLYLLLSKKLSSPDLN